MNQAGFLQICNTVMCINKDVALEKYRSRNNVLLYVFRRCNVINGRTVKAIESWSTKSLITFRRFWSLAIDISKEQIGDLLTLVQLFQFHDSTRLPRLDSTHGRFLISKLPLPLRVKQVMRITPTTLCKYSLRRAKTPKISKNENKIKAVVTKRCFSDRGRELVFIQ
jgi:hypothetical protein